VTSLVALLLLAQLDDGSPTPAGTLAAQTAEREHVEQLLEDGRHVRFGTDGKGPVHVWRPAHYRRETAITVVYVHGFFTDVDKAVQEQNLFGQFRDSGINALFVVPESRSWRTDPLYWPDLEVLLKTVERRARLKRPAGPVVVVAHSGGYRSAVEWLKNEQVSKMVLVDALYGSDVEFKKWLDDTSHGPRQLVLVGFDTEQHVEYFLRREPQVARLDDLPYLFDELPQWMHTAPLIYFQSERFDHMGMVTSGRLLPWLLRLVGK
jgi:hypothetical protein